MSISIQVAQPPLSKISTPAFGRGGNLLLLAPFIMFLCLFFVWPIGLMLSRSFYDAAPGQIMAKTKSELSIWSVTTGLPDDHVFEVFGHELVDVLTSRDINKVASRMGDRIPGAATLLNRSAVSLRASQAPAKQTLLSTSALWGDPFTWDTLKASLRVLSEDKYLAAVDLAYASDGTIKVLGDGSLVNVGIYWRTIWMSCAICFVCLILGYPAAYFLTRVKPVWAGICMTLVLIPYWTSVLVRTTGWMALLQREGLLNNILVSLGVIDDSARFQLIFNATGTMIVMVHVLLPVMILPLYNSMLSVPTTQVKAAVSLGAHPFRAFIDVFVPLTRSGIAAGITLVFMLSVGYYVTPALVGGTSGTFIGNVIAFHMQQTLDWGLAAAMSALLFALVVSIYIFQSRAINQTGKAL
ncbi:ABC transporter permease [Ensifer sp. ENS07]|uniref:ABC transporter permease n=1 Tax=Ensifer sp. ENS07 TaxID=2769274 RepID=UPI00177F26FE|nr:ABC transporter permease [Ensifer sp. ENS07]MBD9641749.1 ABC transporter permease [Ensifer sp. ENS07]